METPADQQPSRGLRVRPGVPLGIVIAVVLLIRLPFLNQAIQGDDVYYLAGAEHAQIEPLHPNHTRYVLQGDLVDMRGHPHPPLDMWYLGMLLALVGDIREVPFHAAYILLSLIAAVSMWSLARRFSAEPLWATLLFLAVPAFVINGNSLESDVPFVAFWLAAVASFTAGRLLPAGAALVLAAMAAPQAVFLTPILAVYVWLYARRSAAAWAVTMAPPLTLAGWQLFEKLSGGVLPAALLSRYMSQYGWQALANKPLNAAALSVHLLWIVFPLLVPPAILASWRRRDRETVFLAAWIAIFFAGALVIFFAGSARYLLPIAAPVCLLVSRLKRTWLIAGFLCQMPLSLGLAAANYQHWDAYRQFARSLKPYHRIWTNAEWGLQYYVESEGGRSLQRGQAVRPGDLVVWSELAYPVNFSHGGGILTRVNEVDVRPKIPLRLIGLESKSGYSSASKGLWPFGISRGVVDRVTADVVVERRPTREYLPMNAPEADQQIVSGIYQLEQGSTWRWMSRRAVVLLKSPAVAAPLKVALYIPDASPARRVTVQLEGREAASRTFPGPGTYTLETPAETAGAPTATVTITIDKAFSVPGDARELGIILTGVGFQK